MSLLKAIFFYIDSHALYHHFKKQTAHQIQDEDSNSQAYQRALNLCKLFYSLLLFYLALLVGSMRLSLTSLDSKT